jgi:glutaminase
MPGRSPTTSPNSPAQRRIDWPSRWQACGGVVAAGDAELAFTIQSISKPFVFALALDELGRDEVIRHVGVEPSGEPFNAISLEPSTGRPANP